jgi:cytochrome c553
MTFLHALRTLFLVAIASLAAVALPAGAKAADAAAGKAAAGVCAACHGENGISASGEIPSLAGQPASFLEWQLVYFRAKSRRNEIMQPIAAALSNAAIGDLAAYFASLPPPSPPQAPDSTPALSEAGVKLAAGHRCASCHKDKFTGDAAVARLADQHEDYLLKALRDFKSGARSGGGVAAMPDVVYPLGDDDFKALAHYLSRVP